MTEQHAHLDQWSVRASGNNGPYTAPEAMQFILVGMVSGHPQVADGPLQSSIVVKLDGKGRRAETLNTVYTLGEPEPGFVKFLAAKGKKVDDYDWK